MKWVVRGSMSSRVLCLSGKPLLIFHKNSPTAVDGSANFRFGNKIVQITEVGRLRSMDPSIPWAEGSLLIFEMFGPPMVLKYKLR